MAPIIKKREIISSNGIRLSRRLAKKRRNKRLFIFLIIMAVLLTVFGGQLPEPAKELPERVALFFSNINPFSSKSDDTVAPSSRKLDDDPERTIVLVLGVDGESGKELIDGATVLSLDFSEESVNGISIPKDTFVAVPPLGFKRLSDAITLGDESKAVGAIQDLLGVKITGFVKLKAADYQTILTDQFDGIFDKDIGSDLSEADKTKIDLLIAKTKSFDDIGIVPLPVKSYVVGNESYFEPNDEELEGLIERIWGIKVERVAKTSVMVFNGSGMPGVATDAANKLINGGFKVIGSRNADNFDYKETEVWDYGRGSKAPQKVLKILKVGKIVKKPVTQDIADVLVVIGQDYNPEP